MTVKDGTASLKQVSTTAWHAVSADEALRELSSSSKGLSVNEARQRLHSYGPNALPPPITVPVWRRFLRHFNDPIIMLLLAAAVISMLFSHYIDAGVILAVVIINAIIGFVQEGRAEQSLSALRSMLSPTARVLRDGERVVLAVEELVPGDILLLDAGDRVPADARLLHARGVRIDESILTGESVPAEKSSEAVAADAVLGERSSMLYSGTLIATGQATAVVVVTGSQTEIGHISTLLSSVETITTPLLEQISRFGRLFTVFVLAMAAILFVFAVSVRDYGWIDALMVVIAVTVGVVPEGLTAVITITLAIGVQRMASRNAIVRRLPAVETLGATTVICSDKTGTLTRNEMSARSIVTTAGKVQAEGDGYVPVGNLEVQEGSADALAAAQYLAGIGLLCNDAKLIEKDGQWRVDGDPMEGALLALAARSGFDATELHSRFPRLDSVPFDAGHRFMATLHSEAKGAVVCVKGAPEQLLALCSAQLAADTKQSEALDMAFWEAAIETAAAQGQRVLGFAVRKLTLPPEALPLEGVKELTFVGIIGFIDPPRYEAIRAVADCRSAGIAVKMITGDHAATAQAIAKQLCLADEIRAVTGPELDTITDEELPQLTKVVSVFARTTPEHKIRIVRALQSLGHTVAMTGDGVNDAPSLKQADIGVAMGRNGTEAAKQASVMVLADDNFASINAAVYEGRAVYDNIRKVIAWTLPTNGGEALTITLALLAGLTLPMTAPQILWINMVLTVTLGLALAFELPERDLMSRPPRKREESLVTSFMLWRIIVVSILFTIGAFGVFSWAHASGYDVETARTMVVNLFCVMEVFYLFNVRYMRTSSMSLQALRGTPAVWAAVVVVIIAQLIFTYSPWMHVIFESRPLALSEWFVLVMCGVVLMVLLEFEKWLLRRFSLFQ
ncbi:MAG: HAD-IC family P-type ATPase [Alcaligenaceae bacterium]|nr:HAD-IC family P-type ATPase [Alcaligenaceae bacterium]